MWWGEVRWGEVVTKLVFYQLFKLGDVKKEESVGLDLSCEQTLWEWLSGNTNIVEEKKGKYYNIINQDTTAWPESETENNNENHPDHHNPFKPKYWGSISWRKGGEQCNPIKSVRIIKLKLEKYKRGDDSQVLLKKIKLQFGETRRTLQNVCCVPCSTLVYLESRLSSLHLVRGLLSLLADSF